MRDNQENSEGQIIEDYFPTNNDPLLNANSIVNSDAKAIHDKLNNYEKLDTEERHSTVRNLPILLEQLGTQGSLIIKPLLYQIMKDRDNITKTLLSKMPDIVIYLEKHQNFESNLKNTLIPILIQFLNFNQLDVKESAGQQLGRLAHRLSDKDRGDFVLKHVIEMAHDDSNEDNRIVAVQLFSSMIECFGKQLCEQFIGLQILSLGDDTSIKVRKQAIKHLPIISKMVSNQFFSKRFLPFFSEKAQDSSNWAIRKSCVDIIIDISERTDSKEKENLLSDIMITFLKDSNKWVRLSSYKNLGKFIYILKGLKMNEKLLVQFCKMADSDVNSIGKQNEIIYACAYNFPAVTDALGKNRWPQLVKLYEKLLKSTDKKIKITLSESLHEIAKIIGEQYTQQYLFKVIDQFFKQKNDEIKLGIIKNLAQIMRVLSIQKRQSLVGVFEEFQKDQKKWRIRLMIGKQLGKLLQIYSPQIIFQYVVPILLKFCSDSVSIVREEAGGKVAQFIEKLSQSNQYEGLRQGLIESIKAFGASPKYTQRQAFLIMSTKLMKHKQLFLQNFMEIFVELKSDKVINVKLVMAEIVRKHFDDKGCLCQQQNFKQLYEDLKKDQNEEIRDVFQDF